MEETSRQLVKENRQPIPAEAGRPICCEYGYDRNGGCNLFMFFEPLGRKRHVSVTDRRTKVDWAMQTKGVLDVQLPKRKCNAHTLNVCSVFEFGPNIPK